MAVVPLTPEELAALDERIGAWADREQQTNELLVAVDREPHERRWHVRLRGDEKSFITVWLTVRERTLHVETYFMPAPEENVEALWEYLLRVNAKVVGVHFAVGLEDAVYLMGQVPVSTVDDHTLDWAVGSCWAYSEQYFRPAMTIGYASRFSPR